MIKQELALRIGGEY